MTTNQTIEGVPRATLANFIEYSVPVSGNDEAWLREKAELRALLDAPAVSLADEGEMPDAQAQGEPVAYADPKAFENFGTLAHLGGLYAREWMWANPAPGLVPLYAEQPALVAVVLPERLTAAELEELEVIEAFIHGQGLSNLAGTMAAARQFIDEVTRINPSL